MEKTQHSFVVGNRDRTKYKLFVVEQAHYSKNRDLLSQELSLLFAAAPLAKSIQTQYHFVDHRSVLYVRALLTETPLECDLEKRRKYHQSCSVYKLGILFFADS